MSKIRSAEMPAGEFKARCLGVLGDVARTGREVVITKRGKAIARLVPIDPPRGLAGSIRREGDILSPVGQRWAAEDE